MGLSIRVRFALALGTFAIAAVPVRAGLHNTAEPPTSIETNLTKFLTAQLPQVRALAPPDPLTGNQPSEGRKDYLQKVQQLRDKQAAGRLSAVEQANLGAYLIRLRRSRDGVPLMEEALQLLEAARREHPRDFYILANLGTAYQITGRLDAAESCLQDAEALAPKEHHTFERYHLLLVRLRLREQLAPGLAPLDQLFVGPNREPARFVGENGQWGIGEMAASEVKKLPGGSLEEATKIVQQLLLWLPEDARLHWLLGELANARQDYVAAARAMEAAVYDFRLSTPELRQRRARLQEAAGWQMFFARLGGLEKQRDWFSRALAAGLQGAGPTPDVGQQAVWQWRLVPKPDPFTPEDSTAPAESSALAALSNLDWRGWSIIAIGGALILFLVFMQARQVRRRRTEAQTKSR
jgi:tetratricopeptide (TPR) repeat protein